MLLQVARSGLVDIDRVLLRLQSYGGFVIRHSSSKKSAGALSEKSPELNELVNMLTMRSNHDWPPAIFPKTEAQTPRC